MKRRSAREYALQFLYRIGFLEVAESPESLRSALAAFWADAKEEDHDVRSFAENIIEGTIRHLAELDDEIQRAADKWDIGRMASVDRTILRMAGYELLKRPDIPAAVSINEALEIAKKYSTGDSAAFINGILDRIARDVEGTRKAPKKPLQTQSES
ncbi:MAG TPA: transcription antitermination factor NusB [Dissulfurispiraceae bacterium]|nr:transcription antitermination factor NusB [Dissulfurispiraceae bacterium]